jgi:hypothetical protein
MMTYPYSHTKIVRRDGFLFIKIEISLSYHSITRINLQSRMSAAEGPAGNLRKRKSQTVLNSEKIANGQSTAMMKINARPTEHGQEMDKKLDEHESYVLI